MFDCIDLEADDEYPCDNGVSFSSMTSLMKQCDRRNDSLSSARSIVLFGTSFVLLDGEVSANCRERFTNVLARPYE